MDEELAKYLLDRDDNLEEVMEQGETKKEGSSQMLSCVGIEANIDEEEFNNIQNSMIESSDDTWSPNREPEVDSSSEEDETIEMDSGTDDSGDEDYTPYIHIRTGAALQKTLQLETLQEINIEDTVHDCNIPEATDQRLTSKKGLPRRGSKALWFAVRSSCTINRGTSTTPTDLR
nr:uncharacterized protein LOC129154649 isoform X4 [Nothobranchius furzeri]